MMGNDVYLKESYYRKAHLTDCPKNKDFFMVIEIFRSESTDPL